jgi:uncharacterized protein (TIGR02118 family)
MRQIMNIMQCAHGLTHEEFMATWADSAAARPKGCARYVQYHIQPNPPSPPSSPRLMLQVDGIEEIWLEDDIAVDAYLARRNSSNEPPAALVRAMVTLRFEEAEVINNLRPGEPDREMLRRLVALIRKAGFTHEQFIRHWVDIHAPLVKGNIGGARRYHQLYTMSELPLPPGIAHLGVEIDGFSESWFDDVGHLNADTPKGQQIRLDNQKYVEMSKVIFFKEVELS